MQRRVSATLKEVLESSLMNEVEEKEKLFRELLVHPKIKKVNGRGLMLAVELESPEYTLDVAKRCMEKDSLFFGNSIEMNYEDLSTANH